MNKQDTCQRCGQASPPTNTFCQHCGAELTSGPKPVGYAPPVTQPPPAHGPPKRKSALPWIIGIAAGCLLIILISALAGIAVPNYYGMKEKAKEAEIKANLHTIQLAVERFAVDHDGAYPSYLIGGAANCAQTVVVPGDSADAFQNIVDCPNQANLSDPILRMGYFTAYPRNPFIRNGVAIDQVQKHLDSDATPEDPLRNETATGKQLGTRFGAYCTAMGSVLADNRFEKWTYISPAGESSYEEDTWANIEYPFWDMWIGNKSLPYLPGMFFYKGIGPIVDFADISAFSVTNPIPPVEIDQYIMGAYGGIRTKGKDVLGDEQQFWLPGEQNRSAELVWPWTRSAVVRDNQSLGGSPFKSVAKQSDPQFEYGNPNGIRDGLILVVTAGEDYIGDR